MEVRCPKCSQHVGGDDVNVAKDLGYCRACHEAFALSDAVAAEEFGNVDFSRPPKGVEITDVANRLTLSSTLWSSSGCFFIIFALFWNSLVSVFLSVGIAQAIKGEGDIFEGGPFPGFFWLFMTPFVLVGLGMGYMALLSVFGRMRVTVDGARVEAFTGLGALGWTKQADWDEVTAVRITTSGITQNNQPMMCVELDGPKPIKFGSFISEERREFIAAVLHRMLQQRDRRRM